MSVERFTRSEFEKALAFAPLGYKFDGAKTGQLEYKIPVATKLTCKACGREFYAHFKSNGTSKCPQCGLVSPISPSVVKGGELYIRVYSSIDPRSGIARDTGEDSIRLVLFNRQDKPLCKLGHYVTRVPGWQRRLRAKARELWGIARRLPRCTKGHKAQLCKCRSGQNVGRVFAKCWIDNEWLGWFDV
jgi:hypothetical protein